jgi:hypothetical protein
MADIILPESFNNSRKTFVACKEIFREERDEVICRRLGVFENNI